MGERAIYSRGRLDELRAGLASCRGLVQGHRVCIYATGSFGRLEAWSGSDIDLFPLRDDGADTEPMPVLTLIPLFARLIEVTADLNFPPFSGDGKYLELGSVAHMERVLGSPEDDSLNTFTSRMLLLLESQPLYDDQVYDALLERIIGFYFRDFEDHSDSFVPAFLLNDILRFWRTLTLNYEHDRLKLRDLTGKELEVRKAKSAIKNYKLKFSRLATCYSMVANLVAEDAPVTAARVLDLCRTVPQERIARMASSDSHAAQIVDNLREGYEEFLETVQRDEPELIEAFSKPEKRKDALSRADEYGRHMFQLIQSVAKPDRLRYMVV